MEQRVPHLLPTLPLSESRGRVLHDIRLLPQRGLEHKRTQWLRLNRSIQSCRAEELPDYTRTTLAMRNTYSLLPQSNRAILHRPIRHSRRATQQRLADWTGNVELQRHACLHLREVRQHRAEKLVRTRHGRISRASGHHQRHPGVYVAQAASYLAIYDQVATPERPPSSGNEFHHDGHADDQRHRRISWSSNAQRNVELPALALAAECEYSHLSDLPVYDLAGDFGLFSCGNNRHRRRYHQPRDGGFHHYNHRAGASGELPCRQRSDRRRNVWLTDSGGCADRSNKLPVQRSSGWRLHRGFGRRGGRRHNSLRPGQRPQRSMRSLNVLESQDFGNPDSGASLVQSTSRAGI